METKNTEKVKKLSTLSGLITGVVMSAFFLLMSFLKLHYIIQLHFINLIFVTAGIYYTLSVAKKDMGKLRYLNGFMLGFKTTYVAVAVFSVFLVAYLTGINPAFMQFIKENSPLGFYMNPWIIAGVIFGEVLSAGVIISLILILVFEAEPETE